MKNTTALALLATAALGVAPAAAHAGTTQIGTAACASSEIDLQVLGTGHLRIDGLNRDRRGDTVLLGHFAVKRHPRTVTFVRDLGCKTQRATITVRRSGRFALSLRRFDGNDGFSRLTVTGGHQSWAVETIFPAD